MSETESILVDIGDKKVEIWNIIAGEDEHGSFISFDCDTEDEKEQEVVKSMVEEAVKNYSTETIDEEE